MDQCPNKGYGSDGKYHHDGPFIAADGCAKIDNWLRGQGAIGVEDSVGQVESPLGEDHEDRSYPGLGTAHQHERLDVAARVETPGFTAGVEVEAVTNSRGGSQNCSQHGDGNAVGMGDRKSTRLNSSHVATSYAV